MQHEGPCCACSSMESTINTTPSASGEFLPLFRFPHRPAQQLLKIIDLCRWSGWSKVKVQRAETEAIIYLVGDMTIKVSIHHSNVVFSIQTKSNRPLCFRTMQVAPPKLRDFILNQKMMKRWMSDRDLRVLMFMKMVMSVKWKKIKHEPNRDPISKEDRDAIWEAAPRVPCYGDRFRFDVLGNVVCRGLGSLEYAHPLGGDIEHIYPRSLGGKSDKSNFCLLSARVNRYKGATPLLICIDDRVIQAFKAFSVHPNQVQAIAQRENVPLIETVERDTGKKVIVVDPAWRRKGNS
ncbi:hypothetical protein HDV05_006443 [Chytridiales sp. JEL 0842]|nr:hypothetical protein HDV05_006443 [Chytridiales sp. JEL 0842]